MSKRKNTLSSALQVVLGVGLAGVLIAAAGCSSGSGGGSSTTGPGDGGSGKTYIGLWKPIKAGPSSEVDVSVTDQKFDVRNDGTIVYSVNVPPIVCQKTSSYTATGAGTSSGTWTTTITASNCPDGERVGLRRHGTWAMPDEDTLNWFYEGRDNPGDEVNHVIMRRL